MLRSVQNIEGNKTQSLPRFG